MTSQGSPRKTVILSVLLLVFMAVNLGVVGSAQAASDPMKMVPNSSLFCVRINSLDNALGQTDLFLAGVSPIGVSMLAKAQLVNSWAAPTWRAWTPPAALPCSAPCRAALPTRRASGCWSQ